MIKTARESISLNGEWNIIYDHDNRGKSLQLYKKEAYYYHKCVEKIQVPSCWETSKEDYEGEAWYAKSFFIPKNLDGKCLYLHFDAVNYKCEVWINDLPVGYNVGGYTGFDLSIEDFVQYGSDNTIVVRVISPIITQDIEIDGIGRNQMPHWRAALVAGIYQDVTIHAMESTHVNDIFVEPMIQNMQAIVNINVKNTMLEEKTLRYIVEMVDSEGKLIDSKQEEFCAESGNSQLSVALDATDCRLWCLDDPALYYANVTLCDGDVEVDQYGVRFGMREFTFDQSRFYLNGKPIFIKGVFHECLYPNTLAIPEDMEIVKKELNQAKAGGLNLIRPWRHPLPTYIYDLADEMGLLFIGGVPIECMDFYPNLTPYLEEQITHEFTSMIKRDRNHPCLVIWELFNEIHRMPLKRLKHKVSLQGRLLDPTRVIFDESGGFAGGANLYLPYSKIPVPINDVHSYPNAPLSQEMYDTYVNLSTVKDTTESGVDEHTQSIIKRGYLTNVSEIGYGSLPNLESNIREYAKNGNPLTPDYKYHYRLYHSLKCVLDENDLRSIYPNVESYCEATQVIHAEGNKYMLEACRLNLAIGGIVVHAFTDADWIVGAGLLDIYRDPKLPYCAVKHVFSKTYVPLRSDKPNYTEGESVVIHCSIVHEGDNEQGHLELCVEDDNRCKVYRKNIDVAISTGVNPMKAVQLDHLVAGKYSIKTKLNTSTHGTSTNTYTIHVMPQLDWSDLTVTVLDHDCELKSYLIDRGAKVGIFKEDMPINQPLFIGRIDERYRSTYIKVKSWIAKGGKAVYLDIPKGEKVLGPTSWRFIYEDRDIIPFDLEMVNGKGLWTGHNHVIKEHPIFDGLPQKGMMNNNWFNLIPDRSITNFEKDWIAGMITYDWYGGDNSKQTYKGVTDIYASSDIVVKTFEKGQCILITLPVMDTLIKEPFAQRILYNLVRWLG